MTPRRASSGRPERRPLPLLHDQEGVASRRSRKCSSGAGRCADDDERPASDAMFEIVLQKVLNMLNAELEDVNTNPATVQQLAASAAALKAHVS